MLKLIACVALLHAVVGAQGGFVENRGQLPTEARFHARQGRMSVFVRDASFIVQLRGAATEGERLRGANVFFALEGADARARVEAIEPLAGRINYLIGDDASQWVTDVPTWAAVRARGVRPGVDLDFKAHGGAIEYDVVLADGVAIDGVVFHVRGGDGMAIDAGGALTIATPVGVLRQEIPAAFQIDRDGRRTPVAVRFRMIDPERFGFEADGATPGAAMVVDPILTYAGYLSGGNGDEAYAITTDATGAVYTAGRSASTNYPVSPGAFDSNLNGSFDGFVTKSSPSGTALVYSTYIGSTGTDNVTAIVVNASGQATITGLTGSGFPTTAGAYDTTYDAWKDAFVTRLNATGTGLVFSTFFGGSHDDHGTAIAIDAAGNLYVGGKTRSTNLPVPPGSSSTINGGFWDGFVAKLNANATALLAATYVGGTDIDWIHGLALASNGDILVGGSSESANFPTTAGSYDPTPNGNLDAFVVRFNPGLTSRIYATMLGSPGLDHGHGLAIGPGDTAYITGVALPGFPSTAGAYDTQNDNGDAYVARLSASGSSLVYCTFIGGSGTEQADAIVVDASGVAWITGFTTSTNFPVTAGAPMPTFGGGGAPGDAFVAKIGAQGSRLDYATYFGGTGYEEGRAIARGQGGVVLIAGSGSSTNIPVPSGDFDTPAGQDDGFFARLDVPLAVTTGLGAGYSPSPPHLTLTLPEPPVLGQILTLAVTAAPPSAAGTLVVSAPAPTTLFSGVVPIYVSVSGYLVLGTFTASPAGAFTMQVPLPADASLASLPAHLQAVATNPLSPAGFESSNGVAVTLGF